MKNTDHLVIGEDLVSSQTNEKISKIIKAIERYFQWLVNNPFLKACNFILIGWVAGRAINQSNEEWNIIMIVLPTLIQSLIIMVPVLTFYLLKFILFYTQRKAKPPVGFRSA